MVVGKGAKERETKRWKPSLLIHDFRRSATRNLIQRGVSQAVAMAISGHATDSVFRRYQIISEADILDAGAKISSKPVVATGDQRQEANSHKSVTNRLESTQHFA